MESLSKHMKFVSYFSSKHMLCYSSKAPPRGVSDEYPQHMFSWTNKTIFIGYMLLIRAMYTRRLSIFVYVHTQCLDFSQNLSKAKPWMHRLIGIC